MAHLFKECQYSFPVPAGKHCAFSGAREKAIIIFALFLVGHSPLMILLQKTYMMYCTVGRLCSGPEIFLYTDRKKSAKIEISMNIYSWGGVKLRYHLNFNDI